MSHPLYFLYLAKIPPICPSICILPRPVRFRPPCASRTLLYFARSTLQKSVLCVLQPAIPASAPRPFTSASAILSVRPRPSVRPDIVAKCRLSLARGFVSRASTLAPTLTDSGANERPTDRRPMTRRGCANQKAAYRTALRNIVIASDRAKDGPRCNLDKHRIAIAYPPCQHMCKKRRAIPALVFQACGSPLHFFARIKTFVARERPRALSINELEQRRHFDTLRCNSLYL